MSRPRCTGSPAATTNGDSPSFHSMFGPGFGSGSSHGGGGRQSSGGDVVVSPPSDDVSGSIEVSVVLDDALASSAVVDAAALEDVSGSGVSVVVSALVVVNTAGSAEP